MPYENSTCLSKTSSNSSSQKQSFIIFMELCDILFWKVIIDIGLMSQKWDFQKQKLQSFLGFEVPGLGWGLRVFFMTYVLLDIWPCQNI